MTPLALSRFGLPLRTIARAVAGHVVLAEASEGRVLAFAAWDESKHPRHPSGDEQGGEFAPAADTAVEVEDFMQGLGKSWYKTPQLNKDGSADIWHVTSADAASSILREGFKPGKAVGPFQGFAPAVQGTYGFGTKARAIFEIQRVVQEAGGKPADFSIIQIRVPKKDLHQLQGDEDFDSRARGAEAYKGGSVVLPGRTSGDWVKTVFYDGSKKDFSQRDFSAIAHRLNALESATRSELQPALREWLAALSEQLRAEARTYAEWDETQHPRHPAGDEQGGEFTEEEKSTGLERLSKVKDAEVGYRHWGDHDRNTEGAKVPSQLWMGDLGFSKGNFIFGGLPQSDSNKYVRMRIPLENLGRAQSSVLREAVARKLSGEKGGVVASDLPMAVKSEGAFFLQSGHHRAAAAVLAGRTHIEADVIEHVKKHQYKRPVVSKKKEYSIQTLHLDDRPIAILLQDALRRAFERGGQDAREEVGASFAAWDETQHPRHPSGDDQGGEFVSIRGLSGSSQKELARTATSETLRRILFSETEADRTKFVKRVLGEWDDDKGPGRLRKEAAALVALTGEGDALSHLHPGAGMAYRGGKQFKGGLIASWTFDKKYAEGYTDAGRLPLTSRQVSSKDNALSLDKAFGAKMGEFLMETHGGRYTAYAESTFTPRKALNWLSDKAFWISGVLAETLVEEAQRILLNGTKTGAPVADMILNLEEAFRPYLGDPDLADPEQAKPYRLETIVRTNTTEAYNHGRLTEFVKPDMLPFLNGIEYSAVLDERTTPVCRFLDGKVFKPEDPALEGLLPPNHFNCRSIVVPRVVGDDVAEFITPAEVAQAQALADQKFLQQQD